MSRKEYVQNRLNTMYLNVYSELQSFIEEHTLRTESKEALNKIYKQESFKLIEEMRNYVP